MPMIGHQAISEKFKVRTALKCLEENLLKRLIVYVFVKDGRAAIGDDTFFATY